MLSQPNIDINTLKNKRCIVFDLETTGFKDSCIVEIGAVEIVKGKITSKTYHSLVNSRKRSNNIAYRVHKLGWRELKNAPKIKEAIPDFLKFVNGDILIAHNLAFDYGVLTREVEFVSGFQSTTKTKTKTTTKTTTKKTSKSKHINNKNSKQDQKNLVNILLSEKMTNSNQENQQLNHQTTNEIITREERFPNEDEKQPKNNKEESNQNQKSTDPNFEIQDKNSNSTNQIQENNNQTQTIHKEINSNQENNPQINTHQKIEKENINQYKIIQGTDKEKQKTKNQTKTNEKLDENKNKTWELFKKSPTFCTMQHSKQLFLKSGFRSNLNFLCEIFGIQIPNGRLNIRHSALEDAQMTAKLLVEYLKVDSQPNLMENAKKKGNKIMEVIKKQKEKEKQEKKRLEKLLPKNQKKVQQKKKKSQRKRKFNLICTDEKKNKALHFFNSSNFEELRKARFITKKKADTILKLRPFSTFCSMIKKIDSSKGITSRVIEIWIEDRIKEEKSKKDNDKNDDENNNQKNENNNQKNESQESEIKNKTEKLINKETTSDILQINKN
ncbi:DNA polymerase iii subunit epsilon [Anaeramoeba flamelloides]|uniref:DNA polymerase iii subunit epsilon n=1 Tax=Anaeramoeba flamelloides TaxID=1746091 RepID=A0AAV7Y7V5_9EUKA|nr:DNA polymerase iii subunit epsilon [Anaeramoeba flamelloides]